jgi:RNA polymerase sigma factor (sigma-70 family)
MDAPVPFVEEFEAQRTRLRRIAYRMLGSIAEADDAVQEAWLRLKQSDTSTVQNPAGLLTTVVGRVCLDMLRKRRLRNEVHLGSRVPEPMVSRDEPITPQHEALLAESVGLALLAVLETLAPGERLAFVLHDMFGISFDEIAGIIGRSPAAVRQLASRGRRRVKGGVRFPDVDIAKQREVVQAFLTAARRRDVAALIAVLDPDVVLRSNRGPASKVVLGASSVAEGAMAFSKLVDHTREAIVNGAAGLVAFHPKGRLYAVLAFRVTKSRIAEIDILLDPERLRRLRLSGFEDQSS